MTDTAAAPAAPATMVVPSIVERMVVTVAGQAGTTAGALMVSWGLVEKDQQSAFVTIAAGIFVAAANFGLTWLIARAHDQRLRNAVEAPAAKAVTK